MQSMIVYTQKESGRSVILVLVKFGFEASSFTSGRGKEHVDGKHKHSGPCLNVPHYQALPSGVISL